MSIAKAKSPSERFLPGPTNFTRRDIGTGINGRAA
jgi:hypothetical protein